MWRLECFANDADDDRMALAIVPLMCPAVGELEVSLIKRGDDDEVGDVRRGGFEVATTVSNGRTDLVNPAFAFGLMTLWGSPATSWR